MIRGRMICPLKCNYYIIRFIMENKVLEIYFRYLSVITNNLK